MATESGCFIEEHPSPEAHDPGSAGAPGAEWRRSRSEGPMGVDVATEVVILRPRDHVASYAADPNHAPEWYVNIKDVRWKTPPPARVGSRVTFVAHFLGRTLEYTYEIVEFVPGRRVVMRTAEGPFPMET